MTNCYCGADKKLSLAIVQTPFISHMLEYHEDVANSSAIVMKFTDCFPYEWHAPNKNFKCIMKYCGHHCLHTCLHFNKIWLPMIPLSFISVGYFKCWTLLCFKSTSHHSHISIPLLQRICENEGVFLPPRWYSCTWYSWHLFVYKGNLKWCISYSPT